MPLTVDKDDIREWQPDLDDDAYEDKLLWLSENLCFGELGLCDTPRDSCSLTKLGLLAVSCASWSPPRLILLVVDISR
jgi:hypothetical protein